jgi:DNA end-binding protein Ku
MAATVWKGYLSFGLVSFPVRLFAAARPEAIRFHMLHKKDESRVKEVWFCAGENKRIEKADIVKGYEYAKGKYIVVDDEELKKVAPPTATTMEILRFVKSDEVDPIYFEKSYYVAPEEGTSKPYGLFRKALADSGYDAVAKVTMHGREHIVVIRTVDDGLVLHTVYFASELHEGNRVRGGGGVKFSAKEMELAKQLINSLTGPFEPRQYVDEYRKNVERLIAQKRKGRPVTPVEQPRPGKVLDIMDALKRSLENSRKPSKDSGIKRANGRKRKAA